MHDEATARAQLDAPHTAKPDAVTRRYRWQQWLVVAFGFAVTSTFVAVAWRFAYDQAERAFIIAANEAVDAIARDAGTLDATARGFQALLHSVDDVDGDQFRAFSDDVLERYPFVRGAAFHPRVPAGERTAFLERAAAAGVFEILDGMTIEGQRRNPVVAPGRAEYFPLLYKDLATEDHTVFGLDIARDPMTHAQIDAAIERGTPIVGPPRANIEGTTTLTVAIATYAGKRVPAQVGDRVGTADGVIVLEVDVDLLLTPALAEPATRGERLRGIDAIAARNALQARDDAPIELIRVALEPTWQGDVSLVLTDDTSHRLLSFRATAASPQVDIGQLQHLRTVTLADVRFEVAVMHQLSLSRVDWPLLAFALANGLGLSILAFRVVRSSVITRHMNVQLAAKNREIHAINAGLEQTISARTAALRLANAEVSEMLENLDDAVFMLGPDLTVLDRHSPATRTILGIDEPAGARLDDLFGPAFDDGDPLYAAHSTALSLAFGGDDLQWEMSEPDFVRAVAYRHPRHGPEASLRTLAVKYAPLYDDDGRLERVLVVISDLTEMLALRREAATRQRDNQLVVDVLMELVAMPVVDRRRLLDDAKTELASTRELLLSALDDDRGHAHRSLHTLKGNARMFGLVRLAKAVHTLEDAVAEGHRDVIATCLTQVSTLVDRYRAIEGEYLATNEGRPTSSPMLISAAARLTDSHSPQLDQHARCLGALASRLAHGDVVDVHALLGQYEPMLHDVAERLGKRVDGCTIVGRCDNVYLDATCRPAVTEALTHGLRNAIDHGIETPSRREAAGKPSVGRIWLELAPSRDALELRLCDDGAGIDRSAVTRAAGRDGDPFELAFKPGLTTKTRATEVSGRGLGLDAVRAGLAAIGGHCELRARDGGGSMLVIGVPTSQVIAVSCEGWLSPPCDAADRGQAA